MDIWSLYIVRCQDNSLYTGISNNIDLRIAKHNSGKGSQYTKIKRPVRLVYHESCGIYADALKREAQIKRWRKEKKENLIKYGHPNGPNSN